MPILRIITSRNDDGYTLLELSVVLLLIGVVLLSVFPRYSGILEGRALRQASRALAGVISSLHQQSAISKRVVQLHFDLDRQEFWVTTLEEDNQLVEETTVISQPQKLPGAVRIRDVITPTFGRIARGEAFTRFFPVGLADPSTIHLQNQKNEIFTLIIKPLTGGVAIYDHDVEERAQ